MNNFTNLLLFLLVVVGICHAASVKKTNGSIDVNAAKNEQEEIDKMVEKLNKAEEDASTEDDLLQHNDGNKSGNSKKDSSNVHAVKKEQGESDEMVEKLNKAEEASADGKNSDNPQKAKSVDEADDTSVDKAQKPWSDINEDETSQNKEQDKYLDNMDKTMESETDDSVEVTTASDSLDSESNAETNEEVSEEPNDSSEVKDEVESLDGADQNMEDDAKNDPAIEKRTTRVYDCPPKSCAEVKQRDRNARSKTYNIYINGRMRTVFCEMVINGGGYTFLDKYTVGYNYITQNTINKLFRRRGDVLLRFQKLDNTQAYTIIRPRSRNWLSVQLNTYNGYTSPVNKANNLGRFLYLGTTPSRYARNRGIQGFISNNRQVTFRNCDSNPSNYFAFFSHISRSRKPSNYHKNNLVYERRGVAVDWRRTGILYCASKIPSNFFFTTEMHFGGCGAYTTSDRWLKATIPAKNVAIGIR